MLLFIYYFNMKQTVTDPREKHDILEAVCARFTDHWSNEIKILKIKIIYCRRIGGAPSISVPKKTQFYCNFALLSVLCDSIHLMLHTSSRILPPTMARLFPKSEHLCVGAQQCHWLLWAFDDQQIKVLLKIVTFIKTCCCLLNYSAATHKFIQKISTKKEREIEELVRNT